MYLCDAMLASASESNESAAQRMLVDTQSSLATALARVEGHRCRERFLYRENQVLRSALLHAGVSPAQLQELIRSPGTAAQAVAEPRLRQPSKAPPAQAASAAAPEAGDAFFAAAISAGRPVHYVTPDGKVSPLR